jgi:hypothetical protein
VEDQKRTSRKFASLTYSFGRRRTCSDRLAARTTVKNETVAVPIRAYLSGQAFEPDMIQSMSLALERACEEMGLRPGMDDPATRFVAEKIIKFAQRGIRDPDRLATLTVQGSRSES